MSLRRFKFAWKLLQAWRAERRGEFERAVRVLDEAAGIMPLDASERVHRAMLLLRGQRSREAHVASPRFGTSSKDRTTLTSSTYGTTAHQCCLYWCQGLASGPTRQSRRSSSTAARPSNSASQWCPSTTSTMPSVPVRNGCIGLSGCSNRYRSSHEQPALTAIAESALPHTQFAM